MTIRDQNFRKVKSFHPGQILATPGALEALSQTGQSALEFLGRHLNGDWGDLDREDALANQHSLLDGSRLLSAYHLEDGTKIWIITEAEDDAGRRAATTLLLPSEYYHDHRRTAPGRPHAGSLRDRQSLDACRAF